MFKGSLRRLVSRLPSNGVSWQRKFHIDANKEQELFSVTTTRWLYNDDQQRALRYVPFNVQAFVGVAVRSAGATECLSLEKIQDGTMNRVFSLTFDNGIEFIAKIPFSVAGPKYYRTASEVATLDYLLTEHGIPVPQVRAWCSRAESTPVAVEYIMYEKIPGVPLQEFNATTRPLENDPYVDILPIIQRIESRLANTYFSQIGSIFYQDDLPEPLRQRPLYAPTIQPTANSARFCIGPTVDREFWRAGRTQLDIDRGPWPDTHSYMFALAACARAFVDAQPGGDSEAYHGLISDFEKLVPHIAPPCAPKILWHPDLHDSNILVTEAERPCKLNGIVDWQGATVAPYYLQLSVPPAYSADEHPLIDPEADGGPEFRDFDPRDLKPEEKRRLAVTFRRTCRQKLHEVQVRGADPDLANELYGDLGLAKRLINSPVGAITRGRTEGLESIKCSFIECRTFWGAVVGVDENGQPLIPFPIEISDVEEDRVKKAWESISQDATMCDDLLERLGVPPDSDGIVRANEYDAAKRAVEDAKQAALSGASTEEERDHIAKAWPLQDGKLSMTAESCC
ncbi:hypothetical protein OE88DRAFT_1651524 [Heliocybe sulcata]|uniref:Aminoglycoside phosphotransferase domain-containing protein n=1 Tax=Heliocybe sulcata TaxID=5364 RepID=A0A5C3NLC6_9AGAM|nr:hypothetical protein OE88DRAFT_1651524 [Heliocybe sulcata]